MRTQLVQSRKQSREIQQQLEVAQRKKARGSTQSTTSPSATMSFRSRLNVTAAKVRMLLMVYVLAHCRAEVAVAFALGKGRGPRFEFPCHAEEEPSDLSCELTVLIEEAYIKVDMDHLVNLFDNPDYYGSVAQVHLATRYVMEYDLFHWVVSQNCEKGVAPVVVSMYETAASLVPAEAPQFAQVRLESAFAMVGVAAYTWLKSFRRRWYAKVGKIEIGTDLPQEELQRKAGL